MNPIYKIYKKKYNIDLENVSPHARYCLSDPQQIINKSNKEKIIKKIKKIDYDFNQSNLIKSKSYNLLKNNNKEFIQGLNKFKKKNKNINNIFNDLIISYNQKGYKNINLNENLFKINPLLLQKNEIKKYYTAKQFDNNYINKTNNYNEDINIIYINKLKDLIIEKKEEKREKKIKNNNFNDNNNKNCFDNNINDEEYYFNKRKNEYNNFINKDNLNNNDNIIDDNKKFNKTYNKKFYNSNNENKDDEENIKKLKNYNQNIKNLINSMSEDNYYFNNRNISIKNYNSKHNSFIKKTLIKKNNIKKNSSKKPIKLTKNLSNKNYSRNLNIKHLSFTNQTNIKESNISKDSKDGFISYFFPNKNDEHKYKKLKTFSNEKIIDKNNNIIENSINKNNILSEFYKMSKNNLFKKKNLLKNKYFLTKYNQFKLKSNYSEKINSNNANQILTNYFVDFSKILKKFILYKNFPKKFKNLYMSENLLDSKKNIISKEYELDKNINNIDKKFIKSIINIDLNS